MERKREEKFACVCVCVCVSERERERGRERERVRVKKKHKLANFCRSLGNYVKMEFSEFQTRQRNFLQAKINYNSNFLFYEFSNYFFFIEKR